ncbi:hypothetical protein H8B13_04060 [Hymenobacter sp. BT188]|uniref:hypothetical protein n=1 Tax=Hymenobacter sp. BT188 TaxID=2763504 RepID=UPI001651AEFC|nr:hypothetical protein [Hymenobacter sp. BT188]MBC6605985.1 hypothetical protein [Hymenobacter sp. BT188]
MKNKEQVLVSSGELNRMRILSRYTLLRTLPESLLDDLVCLTAALFDVPVVLVSFAAAETEEQAATYEAFGWDASGEEDFGTVAIRRSETALLEEMAPKPLELANPFVTRALNFRFYAATALKGTNGQNLGNLCVVGRRPRTFSPTERDVLSNMSALIIRILDLRRVIGRESAALASMWNAIYDASTDSLHRILALTDRLKQQEDLETITAVIQRKLICKDANLIAGIADQHISGLLENQ